MEKKELSKSEQTKEQILYAVAMLMKREDLSEINVRAICKEAGISIGTFYLYFPCKEAAVLYCYRGADKVFDNMVLKDTPIHNIRFIMDTYFHMVDLDNMCTIRQLYICHIKYHDAYFFSEERPVFVRLYQEIDQIIQDPITSRHVAMQTLTTARGMIFHICCVEEKDIDADWHEKSTRELMRYVSYLCDLK